MVGETEKCGLENSQLRLELTKGVSRIFVIGAALLSPWPTKDYDKDIMMSSEKVLGRMFFFFFNFWRLSI